MFSKGTGLVVKEIINTTTRLGQRRASIELQKGLEPRVRRNSICGPCIDEPVVLPTQHTNPSINQYHTSKPIHPDLTNLNDTIPTILENGNPLSKKEDKLINLIQRRRSLDLGDSSSIRRFSFDGNDIFGFPSKRMSNISEINVGDLTKLNIYNNGLKNEITSNNVIDIDSKRVFDSVWNDLIKKFGVQNLNLPKDVTFLLGGPGAGKGTNTTILSKSLGIDSQPIVMSSLLNNQECQLLKKSGRLVNDNLVLELLLKEITKPDVTGARAKGIIIDGFPRNEKQTKFVELLYEKMVELRQRINPNASNPKFRITVLHVGEQESVSRQLNRGIKTIKENEQRKLDNLPQLEVRDTDIDPAACKKRYDIYLAEYQNLQRLSKKFEYTEINANGDKAQVETLIQKNYNFNSNL